MHTNTVRGTRTAGLAGLFVALLMPLTAGAQASQPPAAAPAPPPGPALDEVTWNVRTFRRGDSPRDAPVGTSAPLTIAFRGDRVSGSAGCNTFRGLARRNGRTIEIGPLATTEKACAPEVMTEERAFIAALSSAATWRVRQSTLELLSSTGGRLVSARRGAALPPDAATASPGSGPQAPAQARPSRLVGPVWRLVSLDRWRENDPALESAGITARFTPERVIGHAGCNRYSATARIDGPRLVVRGVVGTLMACPAIDIEQAFKQALGRTERFEIKDGRLLVTYDGDKVMTFAPAPPPA